MIWMVDDDDDDLEFFREALQRNGYLGDTRYIHSGMQVLEFLKQLPLHEIPSVIVLDLNMNTKSGFEVIAELKSDPALRGIPIIILSGSADKADEEKCLALGCERYWQKPGSMQAYDAMAGYLMKLF